MRIHGLTTCVNYASELKGVLPYWMGHLSSLVVVTTPNDEDTKALCNIYSRGVMVHQTTAFYQERAHFNKGRAMEEALYMMPPDGWHVFFDADIVPDERLSLVVGSIHDRTKLYGSYRYQSFLSGDFYRPNYIPDLIPDDQVGYGYFQLFHSSNPLVQRRPLLSTNWKHAGGYDSDFIALWGKAEPLPVKMYHIGQGRNWFGKGNDRLFQEMQKERLRTGGISPNEKI